jgi:hypothetical protein
MLDSKPLLPLA